MCPYALPSGVSAEPEAAGAGVSPPDWLPNRAGLLVAGKPDAPAWAVLERETGLVHPKAFFWLLRNNKPVHLIHGRPITDHPALQHLRGVPVGKGGHAGTFDQLAGVGEPIVLRTDRLMASGSACLAAHEIAHSLDLHVFGRASDAPWWRAVWRQATWTDPYSREHADEAWAETYARRCRRLPVPPEAETYFRQVLRAYGWE